MASDSTTVCKIQIAAAGRQLDVAAGRTLADMLREAGIPLRADCGGNGKCEKCGVKIRSEDPAATDGWEAVLACQTTVGSDLEIDLIAENCIDTATVRNKLTGRRPALGPVFPRSGGRPVLAVDLGTTTLAGFLCDRKEGRVLGAASLRNPQAIFGADVVSRMTAVMKDDGHLETLQAIVGRAIANIAKSLCKKNDVDVTDLGEIVIVGNPTMLHLALGVDPAGLGRAPFNPVFTNAQTRPAKLLDPRFDDSARVKTAPLVSAYLGADIVAAGLMHDIDRAADHLLIIDIGTNGEILLCVNGKIYGSSCATGPALEGATISSGMLALPGAIDTWRIDGNGQHGLYTTVKNAPGETSPVKGICGSGIVSAVAALFGAGIIEASGRIDAQKAGRLLTRDATGIPAIILAPAGETEYGRDVVLTQKDIRAVQLAKGALRAGLDTLCNAAGIEAPDRLYIAGAFGNFLHVDDLVCLGFLPPVRREHVKMVGNAAGEGAVCSAFSADFQARADALAQRVEVLNLAEQASFREAFVKALGFGMAS